MRSVGIGEVNKLRTVQGGCAGEIDVITNEHRGAWLPGGVKSTAGIGQDESSASSGGCDPHSMHHRVYSVLLIQVGTSYKDQNPMVSHGEAPYVPLVAGNVGAVESGQICNG